MARQVQLLLIETSREEGARLDDLLVRLSTLAELAPTDGDAIAMVPPIQRDHGLALNDAVICASVIGHLDRTRPATSCFLNRNAKDYDNPGIAKALRQRGCRLITRFDQGLAFLLNIG